MSIVGTGVFHLPIPIVVGATAPVGDFIVPMLVVQGVGYSLGEVFELPQFIVTGTGSAPISVGIYHIPILGVSGVGYSGILGKGIFDIPQFSITGGFGYRGSGTYILPLPILSTIPPYIGLGEFIFPVPVGGGIGRSLPISKIYRGIVLNVTNQAISTYSNFPFDNLVYFDGKYLGANAQGIYVLGGDKDGSSQILSKVKTGALNFGDQFMKYVREVWLTYRTDGHLELVIFADENPDIASTSQTEIVSDGIQEENLGVARGLRGRFYTLELKNLSGADFDIEGLSVLIDAIKKRVR